MDWIDNDLSVTSADVAEVSTAKQISMNVKVPLDKYCKSYGIYCIGKIIVLSGNIATSQLLKNCHGNSDD